jgi:hypothetical protein
MEIKTFFPSDNLKPFPLLVFFTNKHDELG